MINQAVLDKVKPGASVRVFETITEVDKKGKEKTRRTRFEGLILSRKHGSEIGASFTVRSTIGGVGVEKVFPIHMPSIEKIEILSSPKKVKKSKLYYMRDLSRKILRRKLATVFRKGAAIGDVNAGLAVADELVEEKPEEEEVKEEETTEVETEEIKEEEKETA